MAIGAPELKTHELGEKIRFLRSFALFSELSDSELEGVSQVTQELELAPGAVLLTQNEPADAVYFLRNGAVKILVNGEMVAQIDRAQCFGEMSCLTPDTPASASVVTAKTSHLLRIAKDDFLKAVNQLNKLWKMLFLQMSERVRAANSRLSEILNHLPQGLVKVSPEGIVSNDYSVQSTRIFRKDNLAGLSFWKITFPDDVKKQSLWLENFKLFSADCNMSFEELSKIQISEFSLNYGEDTREYAMTYAPCKNAFGKIIAVDIGVEDITEQNELKRRNQEIEARQEIMNKISQNPDSFLNFLALAEEVDVEATDFVKNLESQGMRAVSQRIEKIMRRLHNLKGISGVFSLKDFRHVIHETESLIGEAKGETADQSQVAVNLNKSLEKFKSEKEKTKGIIEKMPSELRRRLLGVVFSPQEFSSLKNLIAIANDQSLAKLVTSIERVDSKKLVEHWPQEAQKIADVLGKAVQFHVMGEGGPISKELFMELDKVLIHLLRNGLDHGLEMPDARIKRGKPEHGTIEVTIDVAAPDFVMLVEDDGNGIDTEALVKRARQNKAFDQKLIDQYIASGEVWRILFLSGFSTAEKVTDLSGRGVGLDSVASSIEGLGGTLTIESEFGKGTRFLIMLPI